MNEADTILMRRAILDAVAAGLTGVTALNTRQLNDISRQIRNSRSEAKPKPSMSEMLVRTASCHLLAAISRRPAAEIAARRFADSDRLLQALAAPTGEWQARGVVGPAMTSVPGWAQELVGRSSVDGLAAMAPASVFSQLAERGAYRLSFVGIGSILVPTRTTPPVANGGFVGEGQPIPVRRLGLVGLPFTPKKAAVISHFSSEIDAYSLPNIEGVVRQAISEDTAVVIDAMLLDAVVGNAIRPAGLLAGVVPIPGSAGGGINALSADIKALAAAITATGPLIDPILIADAGSALTIGLIAPGSIPVISGAGVAADSLVMVDCGDFVSGGGDLEFDVSKDALIHAADPALPAVSGGVANPLTSLWQQDLIGVKMTEDITWGMRRPGRVAVVEVTTW